MTATLTTEPLALLFVTVSVRLPSALTTVTSVVVTSNVPSPLISDWTVFDRPVALVVMTVLSRSELSAFRSVMVSVRLPSAFNTVTSVVVRSTVPSPLRSSWTVVERPFALVVVMSLSRNDPSGLRSEAVLTILPFASVLVTRVWSIAPSPLRSRLTVIVLRSALVVVTD